MSASEDGRSVLEMSKADRSVWLMKCPPVVSRSWQAAASSSSSADPSAAHPVVAKVVLSLDPLNNDESSSLQVIEWDKMDTVRTQSKHIKCMNLENQARTDEHDDMDGNYPTREAQSANSRKGFKMELAQNEIGNTPKSYSLNMFKDFVPMCVFSESNQGKFSLEGKVEHKFDMEPHSENFGEYGKLCRERTNKAMIKTRQVLVIGNDYGENMRPLPGMVGLVPSGSKEKKKVPPAKGSETKRTRRDRRELENIIFKLFERQPNWALKALIKETDQPEQFLKEILNDLCVYNKRGPHQGTHELKPEYKKSNEEMDTGS